MAEKDKIEKLLEDYNDVFADILNVLLFKSGLIKQELLSDGPTESVYKAECPGLCNQFTSTFKHVAHFFKNKRLLDKYKPLDEEISHLDAFLDMLRVVTGG